MAIRKIHEVGDPCLTKVCRPVTEFNDRLHELLDDMADTLEEHGLIHMYIIMVVDMVEAEDMIALEL
jgi:peptide deformylase